jgi:hypothetical protein
LRADQTKCRQRWPVQQGRGERDDADRAQQHERCGRTGEAVERERRIGGGKRHDGSGRGEDARHMRAGNTDQTGDPLGAARPLAGGDQQHGQDRREQDAHGGPEVALLHRVIDQEDPTERERHAADPYDPARAEALLERFVDRGGGWSRWRSRL